MKNTSIFKKVLKGTFNFIFYTAIIFLLVFSIANMKVQREDNVANIFGIGMLSVQSSSMESGTDEAIMTHDLIFVRMLDEESRSELQVGDVITYFAYDLEPDNPLVDISGFNTHRIVSIDVVDGQTYLTTRGDNPSITKNDAPIRLDEAISIYSGSKLNQGGSALDYLQTSAGFAIFIVVPVILLLIFEGVLLARNIMAVNKEKLQAQYAKEKEDLAAEKEKMRAQILAELKQQAEQ